MVPPDDCDPESARCARQLLDSVLVVDDDDDARGALRDLLEAHCHPVMEAANGQQALNLLVSQARPRVGLIVLDLRMPVMDGHEFLKVVNSYVRLSIIPVLVVSGYTGDLDASERRRVLASLQTPYAPDQLLRLVGGLLAH